VSAKPKQAIDVTPSASRLTASLRDIGYDFATALADIVDNSISAGASRIDVRIEFDGPRSYVLIADDGMGMSERALHEALRFGSRRSYDDGQLGRFGLGLKTASLSQCRRLTVATRADGSSLRTYIRTLDLDHVIETDRWEITKDATQLVRLIATSRLEERCGTVVFWENLDRLLPEKRPDGTATARRFETLAERAGEYLGMVFHRFLEDTNPTGLVMTVNGMKVEPWNPFAPMEHNRIELPERVFEVIENDQSHEVTYCPVVLPPRHQFSSGEAFENMSGPLKWNRQQGLYIYRADRLIQAGGWCGMRAIDEHTKLARAALDFGTALDHVFQINVAKMRVNLPAQLRPQLERPINEICQHADTVYRSESPGSAKLTQPSSAASSDFVVALRAAAAEVDESAALTRILRCAKSRNSGLFG
jgi:Histidine kinase-, DNA gyrase B-, and HSP90-like ATPase